MGLADKSEDIMSQEHNRQIHDLDREMKTLTYNQGKERSRHKNLTAVPGCHRLFADPHSPWQRERVPEK